MILEILLYFVLFSLIIFCIYDVIKGYYEFKDFKRRCDEYFDKVNSYKNYKKI